MVNVWPSKTVVSVALFTRAWIEMYRPVLPCIQFFGRPLYEGVDWNVLWYMPALDVSCRPLYEGVDWNKFVVVKVAVYCSRPLYEGVDWNGRYKAVYGSLQHVALFTRAWIEIVEHLKIENGTVSRPLYEGVDWNIANEGISLVENASPSLRGRGLKYEIAQDKNRKHLVALFTRAWIEISIGRPLIGRFLSPSSRGRGLK